MSQAHLTTRLGTVFVRVATPTDRVAATVAIEEPPYLPEYEEVRVNGLRSFVVTSRALVDGASARVDCGWEQGATWDDGDPRRPPATG